MLLLALALQAAGAYDPLGVHVDAAGVLRSRTLDPDPRLAEIRKAAKNLPKDPKLLYVSIPRLVAEAKRAVDAGKPVPPDVRWLGGLTRIRYVFVYPEEKDLVVAGPAEPFDATSPFRPLGKLTGRPVLHLDDFAVALRAFSGGKRPDRLGCDIEITKEIHERVAAKTKAVGPAAQVTGFKKACEQIAEAGGPQPVTWFGVEPDTRFAFVCVEADYRLKQLALGVLPSPVTAVTSYRSRIDRPEREHRFSLESAYDALRASPDGLAFELRGTSLKVNGGLLGNPQSTLADASPAARAFVEACNANFDALLRTLLPWADLAGLGDLSLLAALATEGLAEKSGWDPAWLAEGYPVERLPAVKSCATQCSVTVSGQSAIFVAGGVWIKPAEWAAKRAPADDLALKALRPKDGWNASR
jgi:hypothetical protein